MAEEILGSYRVLNYNGALDIICHYPGTEEMYSNTRWPGRDQFLRSHRTPHSHSPLTRSHCNNIEIRSNN